jgi:hypothetical protein
MFLCRHLQQIRYVLNEVSRGSPPEVTDPHWKCELNLEDITL